MAAGFFGFVDFTGFAVGQGPARTHGSGGAGGDWHRRILRLLMFREYQKSLIKDAEAIRRTQAARTEGALKKMEKQQLDILQLKWSKQMLPTLLAEI